MEDLNYQEDNQVTEQPIEQKEVLPQWFPFSRIGVFFVSLLAGTNLIAMIIMSAMLIHVSIVATLTQGSALDMNAITQTASDMMTRNTVWVMIAAYAITIPLCMLIVKGVPKYKNEQKEKWGVSKLLLFFMLSVGLMMFGNIVSVVARGLVTLITGHQMTNPLDSILNADNILGSLVLVVIVAPFVEEFLFRKVLIDRVRVYGDKVAILLSGILFGVFHGNIFQVVYATLLGMILAYVYLKTSKILYCIGLHMAINIIGGALPLLLMRGADMNISSGESLSQLENIPIQSLALGMIGLIELGCMIATIVLFVIYYKKIKLTPGAIEIAKEQRFKTIYLNVGMVLFFILCAIIFIMNAIA